MAPVFARRADEFAALVEGTSTTARERHARLLDVVGQLQAVPARAPRPEFVADLRERLMAEAETVLVPPAARELAATDQRLMLPSTRRRTSRDRRLALGVGSLALLTSAATVAVGSQVALPGDTLYPLKRAIEDARTSLAVGDGETGERLLAHATERLDETAALTRRTVVDAPATETSLRDFTTQAQDGAVLMTEAYVDTGDESRIVDVRDFTGDSMERLVAIEPTLPAQAHDELVAAAQAVVEIDDDARNTCPSCGGEGVTDIPISLISTTALLPDGGAADPGLPDSGGGSDGDPVIPTEVPTDLPTLLPTALPTGAPTEPAPTGEPPQPTLPLPTVTTRLPVPQPTALPTILPTILPTGLPTILPTILPTEVTTPLDPVTSLLSPLDPVTSGLPLPSLGLGEQADDLGAPSPTPLP